MDAKDQTKLLDAGFTIIRDDARHISGTNYKCSIKAKTPDRREWFILEKEFKSVQQMVNRVKDLRNDPKIVKD